LGVHPLHEEDCAPRKIKMATYKDILRTTPTETYLGSNLMAMRDLSPGGTLQQRVYAARAYFVDSLGKHDGDRILVVGDIDANGILQVDYYQEPGPDD
jgi:hypothetical protein